MDARWLITRLAERAVLGVNAENGQSVAFQTVGGVEEASVLREVDVGAASSIQRIGLDGLHQPQAIAVISEGHYFAGKFRDEVGKAAVGGEYGVTWAGTGGQEDVRSTLSVH